MSSPRWIVNLNSKLIILTIFDLVTIFHLETPSATKGPAMSESPHGTQHKVEFTVDKQEFESPTNELTPRQILVEYAKEDPATTTLAEKYGNELRELTDLDHLVTIKEHAKFVVFHQKPTPVS